MINHRQRPDDHIPVFVRHRHNVRHITDTRKQDQVFNERQFFRIVLFRVLQEHLPDDRGAGIVIEWIFVPNFPGIYAGSSPWKQRPRRMMVGDQHRDALRHRITYSLICFDAVIGG